MTQRLIAGAGGLESLKTDLKPSFREHMRETWKTKPNFREEAKKPETLQNTAIGGYWAAVSMLVTSAIFYAIPDLCSNNDYWNDKKMYLIIIVILNSGAANMNWLLSSSFMRRTQMLQESTIKEEAKSSLMSGSYLPVGYRFCHKCNMLAPPRSHHCSLCDGCILRRDFHCYFTGSCIGLTTQRRFIVLLFHIMAGCFMHFGLSISYVNFRTPFTEDYVYYVPFMAIYRLVIGNTTLAEFYFLCQAYLCLVFMLISAAYLTWQWLMVVRGQTSYEAVTSIQTYRTGIFRNIFLVFGPYWWMNFLFPLPTWLHTDGVNWERRTPNKAS